MLPRICNTWHDIACYFKQRRDFIFYTVKAEPFRQPSHGVTVLFPVLFRPPTSVSWPQTLMPLLAHLARSLHRTTTARWFCHGAAVVCWGAPPVCTKFVPIASVQSRSSVVTHGSFQLFYQRRRRYPSALWCSTLHKI